MSNGSDDFKLGEERGFILSELKAINIKLTAHVEDFTQFKQGMGARIEQHGKDIAVMQSENKKCEDERKTFAIKDDVEKNIDKLEKAKNWFVTTIIAGFIGLVYSLFKK